MIEMRLRCRLCLRSMQLVNVDARLVDGEVRATVKLPRGWDGLAACPICVARAAGVPDEALPERLPLGVLPGA